MNIKEDKSIKQKVVLVSGHLLTIFILLVLPEIVMNLSEPEHRTIPMGVYVKVLLCIVVFYLNYFVLFDYCFKPTKSQTVKFVGINLVLLLLALGINHIVWVFTASHFPIHGEPYPMEVPMVGMPQFSEPSVSYPGEFTHLLKALVRIMRDAIILIMIIGLCVAVKFSLRWAQAERTRQELIAKQRENELASLRNQINPHFLFNTLNTIYALIDICPEKARQSVHTLGNMMRYLLYENQCSVRLEDEFKFVEGYVDLMKMRLSDTVPLTVNLNVGNSGEMRIAPVLFMTIIENVFKHGNTGNRNQEMKISVEANDGIVRCETFNYYDSERVKMDKKEGIGLENLRRRLDLLYGEDAKLAIISTENTYSVNLTINLNYNQKLNRI